ncbi:MAG: sugar transferase [Pseudonocardia sp.]|nr:sugar transferase [Pseudonocardia sp.]
MRTDVRVEHDRAGLRQAPLLPAFPHDVTVAAPRVGRRLEWTHRLLLWLADIVVLTSTAGLAAVVLRAARPAWAGGLTAGDVAVTTIAMLAALHLHRLYDRPVDRLRPSGWWRPFAVFRCLPTGVLLAMGLSALMFVDQRLTLTAAVAMTLPGALVVPLGRYLAVRAFRLRSVTRVVVVGTGQVAERVVARLRRCGDTEFVGYVDDVPAPGVEVLGALPDLHALCRAHRADRVIVTFSQSPDALVLAAVRSLSGDIAVSVVPRMFELHSWRSEMEELFGLPLAHVPPASAGLRSRVEKRLLDLAVAVPAMVVLLPLWIFVAIVIKLDSPGPVLFRQERAGEGGRSFRVFKFRTMNANAAQQRSTLVEHQLSDGPLFKMAADPRVTRFGALLRRTSIDELPQLLNVLRGEMSLVGPRPLPVEEADRLDGAALDRLRVAPGITGLWQVSGRSDLTYADLQHLDSVYVRSWSLMWDLRIILATPGAVLGRRGAY